MGEAVWLTLLQEGFLATAWELGALLGVNVAGEPPGVPAFSAAVLTLVEEELLEKTV